MEVVGRTERIAGAGTAASMFKHHQNLLMVDIQWIDSRCSGSGGLVTGLPLPPIGGSPQFPYSTSSLHSPVDLNILVSQIAVAQCKIARFGEAAHLIAGVFGNLQE